MPLKEGDVLLCGNTGAGEESFLSSKADIHKCIVVKISEDSIYVVPITSWKEYSRNDSTCIVDQSTPGLNLTKKSYVAYFASKKLSHRNSLSSLAGAVDQPTLSLVMDGIKKSPQTPEWFRVAIFPPAARRILRSEVT